MKPAPLSFIQEWYHAHKQYYPIVNQNPEELAQMTAKQREMVNNVYLPILTYMWKQLEDETGFAWMCTSYARTSPSHAKGYAMDVAPNISPKDASKYAVNKGSDPVLYKREFLLRHLQNIARQWNDSASFDLHFAISFAVEPDHIHLSLFALESANSKRAFVLKWGGPKTAYADTQSRSRLPIIK